MKYIIDESTLNTKKMEMHHASDVSTNSSLSVVVDQVWPRISIVKRTNKVPQRRWKLLAKYLMNYPKVFTFFIRKLILLQHWTPLWFIYTVVKGIYCYNIFSGCSWYYVPYAKLSQSTCLEWHFSSTNKVWKHYSFHTTLYFPIYKIICLKYSFPPHWDSHTMCRKFFSHKSGVSPKRRA